MKQPPLENLEFLARLESWFERNGVLTKFFSSATFLWPLSCSFWRRCLHLREKLLTCNNSTFSSCFLGVLEVGSFTRLTSYHWSAAHLIFEQQEVFTSSAIFLPIFAASAWLVITRWMSLPGPDPGLLRTKRNILNMFTLLTISWIPV